MMEESQMVMEKARPFLESLSVLAPKLNQATDKYVDELKFIESNLNSLKLGISIELDTFFEVGNRYNEEDEQGVSRVFHRGWTLGYGKNDHGDWCFLVRQFEVPEEGEAVEITKLSLLNASREIRISAAELIPPLLKEMEKQVRKKLDSLAKASESR